MAPVAPPVLTPMTIGLGFSSLRVEGTMPAFLILSGRPKFLNLVTSLVSHVSY